MKHGRALSSGLYIHIIDVYGPQYVIPLAALVPGPGSRASGVTIATGELLPRIHPTLRYRFRSICQLKTRESGDARDVVVYVCESRGATVQVYILV